MMEGRIKAHGNRPHKSAHAIPQAPRYDILSHHIHAIHGLCPCAIESIALTARVTCQLFVQNVSAASFAPRKGYC